MPTLSEIITIASFLISIGVFVWRAAIMSAEIKEAIRVAQAAHERMDKFETNIAPRLEKITTRIEELNINMVKLETKIDTKFDDKVDDLSEYFEKVDRRLATLDEKVKLFR